MGDAFNGWMSLSPLEVESGDMVADVSGGDFVPSVEILGVESVPGTDLARVTTAAGSFVVRGDACVYVFSQAARSR